MIRGTTPTHIFNLPFSADLVAAARVIYKQGQKEILRKETEDFTKDGKSLRTTLTQEDTLLFDCKLNVKIQLRVKTTDGAVLATKPRLVTVEECLDGEVLE